MRHHARMHTFAAELMAAAMCRVRYLGRAHITKCALALPWATGEPERAAPSGAVQTAHFFLGKTSSIFW